MEKYIIGNKYTFVTEKRTDPISIQKLESLDQKSMMNVEIGFGCFFYNWKDFK